MTDGEGAGDRERLIGRPGEAEKGEMYHRNFLLMLSSRIFAIFEGIIWHADKCIMQDAEKGATKKFAELMEEGANLDKT